MPGSRFVGCLEELMLSLLVSTSRIIRILSDLTVPAIEGKELVMREKGIISLSLCRLIDKVIYFLLPSREPCLLIHGCAEHGSEVVPTIPWPSPELSRQV